MNAILLLALQALALPQAIETWRADIEREFKVRVPIVWADGHLQGDSDGFPLAAQQLEQEGFRSQFSLMQAAMVRQRAGGSNRFVVLVNLGWQDSWKGFEEALLGHELGHVWLGARRLPAPVYGGESMGCVSIHAGDTVQHILIRAEMDRRGIHHRPFLEKNLETTAAGLTQTTRSQDPCSWVRQAALWVDGQLAFEGREWPGRDEYQTTAERQLPEVVAAGGRIVSMLRGRDLDSPQAHRQALVEVHHTLQELRETSVIPMVSDADQLKTRYPEP